MNSLILTSFGANLPCTPEHLLEQNVYPIAIRTEDGFDLDCSCLLLFEKFILDKNAYDFLSNDKRQHLKLMKYSIDFLLDKGLITINDFRETTKDSIPELERRTDELLEVPEFWLDTAKKHWAIYKKELPEVTRRIMSKGVEINIDHEFLHFGVYCLLLKSKGHISISEAQHIQQILERKKQKLSAGEKDLLKEITRPILMYVLFNNLLSAKLDCPFVDWADLDLFYQKVNNPTWADISSSSSTHSGEFVKESKHLFEVLIPELKPSSVKDVYKFITKKKAVTSFKEMLRDSLGNGNPIDARLINEVKNQAIRELIADGRRNRNLSFFGKIGGAITEILVPGIGLVNTAIELGAEKILENKTKKYEWLYTLINIKYENEKSIR